MLPSINTKFHRTKVKFPPTSSLCPQSTYQLFPFIHTGRHVGTIFHATTLLGLPKDHQQLNKSTTLLGITHDNPKTTKTSTPSGRSHITMEEKVIHRLHFIKTFIGTIHLSHISHKLQPLSLSLSMLI
jgi:hypothetical protein